MPVISEHQTSIVLDVEPPLRLRVTRQQLTMDEEWVPYVQASLTCAIGDGSIAQLDPTEEDIWATITARQLLGRVDRIRDLSRRWRGKTLGDLSAEYAGGTLADVTTSTYHDYTDPGHPRRETTRTYRLMLRDVDIDWEAGEVQLELTSAEARLFDDMWPGKTPLLIPGETYRDCVNYLLGRSGFEITTIPTGDIPAYTLEDARYWQPGQSAWDALVQMVKASANPFVWCDEHGDFHIDNDRDTGQSRTFRSAGPDRSVRNARERRSRDDGWFTGVMVIWTDEAGVETRGVATTPGRPYRLKIIQRRPGIGPPSDPDLVAERIRQQIVSRSRSLELLAVNDYLATPGDTATFINPRETPNGRVTAVTWEWPADEMRLRLREVTA